MREHGCYRVDTRGNKPGVSAQLHPPAEHLAFAIELPQECGFAKIWPAPLPVVIESLTSAKSTEEFFKHYPDVEIASTPSETIKPVDRQVA